MSEYDDLQKSFRVKVIKKEDDVRTHIAGERFIHPGNRAQHDGTVHPETGELAPYAVISAHAAEQVKATNKHYHFTAPYIPKEEIGKK